MRCKSFGLSKHSSQKVAIIHVYDISTNKINFKSFLFYIFVTHLILFRILRSLDSFWVLTLKKTHSIILVSNIFDIITSQPHTETAVKKCLFNLKFGMKFFTYIQKFCNFGNNYFMFFSLFPGLIWIYNVKNKIFKWLKKLFRASVPVWTRWIYLSKKCLFKILVITTQQLYLLQYLYRDKWMYDIFYDKKNKEKVYRVGSICQKCLFS